MWKILGLLLVVGLVSDSEAVKCMLCPDALASNQQDCKEGKVDDFCEGNVCFKATVRVPVLNIENVVARGCVSQLNICTSETFEGPFNPLEGESVLNSKCFLCSNKDMCNSGITLKVSQLVILLLVALGLRNIVQ